MPLHLDDKAQPIQGKSEDEFCCIAGPSADPLVYQTNQGKPNKKILEQLNPLAQWILAMYLVPQGPLSWPKAKRLIEEYIKVQSTEPIRILVANLNLECEEAIYKEWTLPTFQTEILGFKSSETSELLGSTSDPRLMYSASLKTLISLATPSYETPSTKQDSTSCLSVALLPPRLMNRSNRFTRRFGSHRFLRIKFDEKLIHGKLSSAPDRSNSESDSDGLNIDDGLNEMGFIASNAVNTDAARKVKRAVEHFFSRAVHIFGRLYYAFYSEEKNRIVTIHMFAVSGPRLETIHLGSFIDMHIPTNRANDCVGAQSNKNMQWSKFVSRFQLGLSDSIVPLKVNTSSIFIVPDLLNYTLLISYAAMRKIATAMNLPSWYTPSAIEGLYDGINTVVWRLDYSTCPFKNENADHETWIEYPTKGHNFKLNFSFNIHRLDGTFQRVSIDSKELKPKPRIFKDMEQLDVSSVIMTDGCGQINKVGLHKISDFMKLDTIPSACQMRLGPAKGLLARSPPIGVLDDSHVFIELRPSQIKYKLADIKEHTLDLELLNVSEKPVSSSLNKQTVPVFRHGNVPNEIFKEIQEEEAKQVEDSYLQALDSPRDLRSLFSSKRLTMIKPEKLINSEGIVREHYVDRQKALEEGKIEYVYDMYDLHSGAPKPTAFIERAWMMLNAGVDPLKDPCLSNLSRRIAVSSLPQHNNTWKISVQKSTCLFVTVDTTGTLQEGEIYVFFSQGFYLLNQKEYVYTLEGDVAVTRSPCLASCDIQKVRAVGRCDALNHLSDVVVFSSVGSRPLCAILSGGDYDGDQITMFWDSRLVKHYQSGDPSISDEQPQVDAEYLEKDGRSFSSIKKRFDAIDLGCGRVPTPMDMDRRFSKELISSVWISNCFGLMNMWHSYIAYYQGIDSENALLALRLFCRLLDGKKQGLSITTTKLERAKEVLFSKDGKCIVPSRPRWMAKINNREISNDNFPGYKRGHVIEYLLDCSDGDLNRFKKKWEDKMDEHPVEIDPVLSEFWINFQNEAIKLGATKNEGRLRREDLSAIQEHVQSVKKIHADIFKENAEKREGMNMAFTHKMNKRETTDFRLVDQKLADLSRALWDLTPLKQNLKASIWFETVNTGFSIPDTILRLLIASLLYPSKEDWEKKLIHHHDRATRAWNLPWGFAIRELCFLKSFSQEKEQSGQSVLPITVNSLGSLCLKSIKVLTPNPVVSTLPGEGNLTRQSSLRSTGSFARTSSYNSLDVTSTPQTPKKLPTRHWGRTNSGKVLIGVKWGEPGSLVQPNRNELNDYPLIPNEKRTAGDDSGENKRRKV